MRLLIVALLLGCSKPPPAAAETKYEKGDWIKYRYSGTFTAAPVELQEIVIARDGKKLRIQVVATRGVEMRAWTQVVTDTPFNRKNNVVDELYALKDGKEQKLKNVNNNDLYELYDWTYVVPEGVPLEVTEATVPTTIGGTTYSCHARRGRTKIKGRPAKFEEIDCPEFLWTHASARFVDEETGADIYKAEIVDLGRK